MEIAILAVFVIGYLFIALEHKFHIDKAASAILTGVICWSLYALGGFTEHADHGLLHHLSEIASILFFLLGAMTIVELVDAHNGFSIITDGIKTRNKVKLMWIVSILTFFVSSALDNLTTAIVMISLLRKLIDDKETRWLFAGMVVVAANAGGAWSPIGDVTTTMLWIKGQLPYVGDMMTDLFFPSIICILAPLLVLTFTLKGDLASKADAAGESQNNSSPRWEKILVLCMGLGGLLFVPVFKSVTHLQPFMGMMLSLGVIWVVTDLLHRTKSEADKSKFTVFNVLRKIDSSSVLFFLGILLAVSALKEVGHLENMAHGLSAAFPGTSGIYMINILIGLLSAIVDNVPLVAAAQGMYEMQPGTPFEAGGIFWQLLAFCAGTGGSILIIGSAAGVAVMGLERIDFIWYLKRVSFLALLGYLAGAGVYIVMFGM